MPKKSEEKLKTISAHPKPKRLVLLDAHAILHRAYHALPDFSSSKGEPTGALYGMSTMLLKIIKDFNPDYIIACYDLPQPTHRHEVYDEYKAGRKKTDDALVAQLIRSKDIFVAFNIPIYSHPGFEADDVLGTIVKELKENKGVDIIIASGDMDTMQLVDDKKVQIYTLKKGINDTILYDEEAVVTRFGFKPQFLPDYKGLSGDPSDNIIGIKGIGDKTATTLIQKFGTIEEMYKTLKKDPAALEKEGIKPRIIELLKEHEEDALFSKMLATIRLDAPILFSLPEQTWREGVDVEKILTIFSDLDFKTIGARVKELFSAGKTGVVAGGETKSSHQPSLNELFTEQVNPIELQEVKVALSVLDPSNGDPAVDDILRYANTKSFVQAKEFVMAELKKQQLMGVYENIEKPLIPIVQKMHDRGIVVDADYLKKLSKEYHVELSSLEQKIWKEAGEEFNINSPKQLGEILFEKLALSVKNHKKTSLGVKSTKESELEKMRGLHPVIDHILHYRELQKLLSTYIDSLPMALAKDGRLHTTFLQIGAATGRMSSNNPNLQNIPIKSDLGKKIRNAFVSAEGFELVSFDYSQIELRVAAIMSGDPKLIEIFKNGGDVHTAVASQVFGVAPEAVDHEMRRRAKVINFGILYGMGVNALKANLGTDRAEAQKFYDAYFNTFSVLGQYMENIKAEVSRRGYTETLFGRKRYFPEINSRLPYIRAMAERMAINAPVQGTAADLIKIAMINLDRYFVDQGFEKNVFTLLQVHDELVFEVKESVVKKVMPEIKRIMESVLTLEQSRGVPIVANGRVGKNWGEMG